MFCSAVIEFGFSIIEQDTVRSQPAGKLDAVFVHSAVRNDDVVEFFAAQAQDQAYPLDDRIQHPGATVAFGLLAVNILENFIHIGVSGYSAPVVFAGQHSEEAVWMRLFQSCKERGRAQQVPEEIDPDDQDTQRF